MKKLDKIISCDVKILRFSSFPPDGKKYEPSILKTSFTLNRKEVVLRFFH
jgi:hypothetical protein